MYLYTVLPVTSPMTIAGAPWEADAERSPLFALQGRHNNVDINIFVMA